MEAGLEAVEGDLAHDGVEAVLDLARQQGLALLAFRLGQEAFEDQALAEDRGGLGQGQRGVGQQGALRRGQRLVHGVAQFVGQGQDVAALAHEVKEHIGVAVGGDRVGIGPGLLAGARAGVDPGLGEEHLGRLGELGRQAGVALQHDGLGLFPAIAAGLGAGQGGVAVPMVQHLAAHDLGLEAIVAVADGGVAFHHRRLQRRHRFRVHLVGQVAGSGGGGVLAPAVLDLFFEGQGVEAERQGGFPFRQSLCKGAGRLLAARGVGVGEAVEGLRQGQGLGPDLGGQPGQGLVVEPAPVGDGGAAVDQQMLKVRRQLVRAGQPHAADPGAPAGGGGMGREGCLDLGVLQLVDLEGEEQAVCGDLGRAGAQVGLELRPCGIVAGGGGGQGRVGPHAPEVVGGVLVEADAVVQAPPEARRIGPAGDELALQRDEGVVGGLGGGEVRLDARVVAAGVEIVQPPLRQALGVVEFGGGVHADGFSPSPLAGEPLAVRLGAGANAPLQSGSRGPIPIHSRPEDSPCSVKKGASRNKRANWSSAVQLTGTGVASRPSHGLPRS